MIAPYGPAIHFNDQLIPLLQKFSLFEGLVTDFNSNIICEVALGVGDLYP